LPSAFPGRLVAAHLERRQGTVVLLQRSGYSAAELAKRGSERGIALLNRGERRPKPGDSLKTYHFSLLFVLRRIFLKSGSDLLDELTNSAAQGLPSVVHRALPKGRRSTRHILADPQD
jgi:hypothetical protein